MSGHELWLRLGRDRVTERGYGVTHLPGAVAKRLRSTSTDTGAPTFEIEPASGFACAPADYSLERPLSWEGLTEAFVEVAPYAGKGGVWPPAYARRAPGRWAVTSEPLAVGGGGVLRFITYDGGKPFEVEYGPAKVVVDYGRLTLWLHGKEVASGQLWEAEEWFHQPHYLALYAVGRRIVARRLGPTVRWVAGWLPLPEGETESTLPPALPGGPAVLRGDGYLTFGMWPERHQLELAFESERIALPEPSTMGSIGLTVNLTPEGTDGPRIEVTRYGEDGAEVTGDGAATAFSYRVTATLASAEGPNVYVARVRVKLPRKVEPDGLEGTDLLAAPVAPPEAGWLRAPRVAERRSLDPESSGVSFDLAGARAALAAYLQPNMKGSWRLAGAVAEDPAEQRAEFYTSRPKRTPYPSHETLTYECELGWKRFREAKWPGEFTVAGMALGAAYRRVAEVAGLSDAQMVITAGTAYQLPRERADGQPLFDFRPGQTIAEVLAYLRDHFSLRDILRFCPDGLFHADPRPQAAGEVVFYLAAADETPAPPPPEGEEPLPPPEGLRARLLGTATRPYLYRGTWHERFDERGFANEVEVVGMADDGTPLAAVATDWPSIRDPQRQVGEDEEGQPVYEPTDNYVGEVRRLVIIDAGLTTQALVNWVCRTTLSRVRRLPLVAECTGTFVAGLLEGDIVEVDGRGLWRVTELQTEWTRDFPGGRTRYELERWTPEAG